MIARSSLSALVLLLACEDPPAGDAMTESSSTTTAGTMSTESTTDAPTQGEDDDNATAGTDTEAAGECGAAARCVAAVPDGWLGPVARYRGTAEEEAPGCGGGYPEDGLALLEGFNAPDAAECDCECALSISAACGITMYPDLTTTTCGDFSNLVMNASECTPYEIPNGSLYGTMFAMGGMLGCTPTAPAEIPEVVWDANVFTCGGVELGDECDGGVCTPSAPDGFTEQLCVFAQGENPCPEGTFSEQVLHYTTVRDERGCTECECGTPPPVMCNGTFDVYDNDDCSGSVVATAPTNGCSGPVVGGNSIHINLDQDTSCDVAEAPEPEGTAEPGGTFTFCCEAG